MTKSTKCCLLVLVLFSCCQVLIAQTVLPAARRVDWTKAGMSNPAPSYPQLNILSFGADTTGVNSCHTALAAAISSLAGAPGTIYFPAGKYLFTQPVVLPGSTVLKGAGNTQTQLIFNLSGANSHLITINGNVGTTTTAVAAPVAKDTTALAVSSAAGFAVGDYVRLNQNDAALVTSSWALGSVGQLVQVGSVSGTTIGLRSAVRKNYLLTDAPQLTRLNLQTGSGIECLRIKRLDATTGQTANILIGYAANCWVKGVESDSCNFAHIVLNNATNIEVSGCYFHGAFGYGGNGQGYGIDLEGTSGECLIENNIFRHLRHSMLLQSGANGNVLAYNYSVEPYWTGVFSPSNAAGDMVLHGNWPYANLFEGNIGQNMVIDNSHGRNGWFNTYFRNRGATYGFFMNSGAGDSTNVIGNEITSNFTGLYMLTGVGNFAYGNNVRGTISPAGTANLTEASLYRSTPPAYFAPASPFPAVGPPNVPGSGSIPAMQNDAAGQYVDCGTTTILPIRLKHFTVAPTGCNALLQWTAMDAGGDRYVVENSFNGVDFSTVKTIPADGLQGENIYTTTLAQTEAVKWYRLKMVNQDGQVAYSRMVALSLRCQQTSGFSIQPNPVGTTLQVICHSEENTAHKLLVSDVTGKIVWTRELQVTTGNNTVPVDVQMLAAGLYYIQLKDAAGKPVGAAQKIIKK